MNITKMTRNLLFHYMVERKECIHNGIFYLINAIEIEDGSGQSFNVTLCSVRGHNTIKVHTRTRKLTMPSC